MLTKEQLDKYENRLYELKLLIENTTIQIKFFPRMNKYREHLVKYTKEFKNIKKKLDKAKKEALKNGL